MDRAGITIKQTPKGWTVTGIPKEIANGIQEEYEGRWNGRAHFFRRDPTEAVNDAAREIAEEAEASASAEASGLVRTSIGTLAPEAAEYFEQAKAEQLELARSAIAERNDAVSNLLAQFVPSTQRGSFKLQLLRASERSDSDSIKRFDEMVQYVQDHPELGLPQDESNEQVTTTDAQRRRD